MEKISSTIHVYNQSETNAFSNIFFIISRTLLRFHTNKGNMFVNKYAKFRGYSLHSYFRVSVKCGPDGGGWRMADGG